MSAHLPRRDVSEGLLDELVAVWGSSLLNRTFRRGIGLVKTDDLLRDVARLRYDLYIERDGKPYSAEHDDRLFRDEADLRSLNFYAYSHQEIGASVRLTRAKDANTDAQLQSLIEAAELSACEIERTVINSRLVVKPTLRMRALVYPLFQEVYVTGLLAGAEQSLLTTRDSLVGLFERFGFEATGIHVNDAVAGQLALMRLNLRDFTHLKAIGSVLLDAVDLAAMNIISTEAADGRV